MKTMNASSARKAFAGVLASVVRDGKPVVIVRYNQPIAALVPLHRLHATERAVVKARRRRA